MSAALTAVDTDSLFDLVPYTGSKLEAMEGHTSPEHVAVRIERHEPAKLAMIIRRLREGVAIKRVAEDFGVGRNTVYAIIRKHLGGMEALRKSLANEFFKAAHQGVQKVQELMEDAENVTQAAIATGIMFEKGMLAAGMSADLTPDAPIDPRERESWNEKLRQMRERRARGRVVEEPPAIDGKEAAAAA